MSGAGPLSRAQLAAVAELGYGLLRAGQLQKARQLWEGLAAEAGDLEAPWRALAAIAMRESRWDDAVGLAAIAHQRNPGAPAPLVLRAEALLACGRFADATGDLEAALQRRPRHADDRIVLRRARVLRARVGRAPEAEPST